MPYNPIEAAKELAERLERLGGSTRKAAVKLKVSHSYIAQALSLLELDQRVQELIKQRLITKTHARELRGLSPGKQYSLAQRIIKERISVLKLQDILRGSPKPIRKTDANIQSLEQRLADHFGAKIKIVPKHDGKGALVVKYNSLDELDGILEKIGCLEK